MIICDKCRTSEKHFLNYEIKPVKIEMLWDPNGKVNGHTVEIQLCPNCSKILMTKIIDMVNAYLEEK